MSNNLNFDDVAKEQLRACAHEVYGLLYILSSDFTSPTKRQMEDYNENPKNPIQIKFFNRNDIENFLLQKPELLEKWIYKI